MSREKSGGNPGKPTGKNGKSEYRRHDNGHCFHGSYSTPRIGGAGLSAAGSRREEAIPHAVSDLSILIFNPDLPIFPGGIGIEFLNTTNLAARAARVGLVSMAHDAGALLKARELAARKVSLYLWKNPALEGKANPAGALPPGGVSRFRAGLHRWISDLYLRLRALPFRPADGLVSDLVFRNLSPALSRALTEHAWNVFVVVQSTYAPVIDCIPEQPFSVLVMHDIRSVVYERRAETAAGWRERRRMLSQARRCFELERKYARRYDLVVAVSDHDAEWIRRNYQPRKVTTARLPLDRHYFAPDPARHEVPNRIVFTGLMNHPPNVDAVQYFARQVFPLVRQTVPEAEFYIVGRNPGPEVIRLGDLPGVRVTGEVPDTRPYLAEAAVVVVPLRFGSGARYKILEAWSMGKCVVSTTVGAEGLWHQDGVHLAIADGAEKLAATVARALRDAAFRDSLRKSGRELVAAAHDPERIAEDLYREYLEGVLEASGRQGPMRVVLDLRWMLPGRAGGLENEARALVRELLELDRHNRYTLILPARCRYDFDLRSAPNMRVVSRDSAGSFLAEVAWRAGRIAHGALRLEDSETPEVRALRLLRSLDSEIVYSLPGYIHPELYPLRHVLKVPDIQHEFLPQFFSAEALDERRRLYGESVRIADHICTGSEFTRRTLMERLGVAPEKISTVPLAADPIFRQAGNEANDAVVWRAYGVARGTYLFFPAHTWRHKNHLAAIEALRILRDRHSLTPGLVCTGGAREAQPLIEQRVDAVGLRNSVRFLGYCPGEHLPALYRGAAGLVFPSLFEGFGMPVLEAMSCGCPVVCSNSTSLPEVAGEAALLVDPADPEALAGAIRRLLTEAELRADLIRRGLAQARRFSWRRHALGTVAALYRVHRKIYTGTTR